MEETLREILSVLQEINAKLDDIQGCGLYNSIADIYDKLNDIQGYGLRSISDVYDEVENLN